MQACTALETLHTNTHLISDAFVPCMYIMRTLFVNLGQQTSLEMDSTIVPLMLYYYFTAM